MKDIEGYDGLYAITEDGRVWNWTRNMWMKLTPCGNVNFKDNLYLTVGLCKNNKVKRVRVHRLVGGAYIPNPENKPQINHVDGNKFNNIVSNLEWCTQAENVQHARDTGLINYKNKRDEGSVYRVNCGNWYVVENGYSKRINVEDFEKYNIPIPVRSNHVKEGIPYKRSTGGWAIKENGVIRTLLRKERSKYGIETKYKHAEGDVWQKNKGKYTYTYTIKMGKEVVIPNPKYKDGDVWCNINTNTWYIKENGKTRRMKKKEYETYK